MSSFRWLTSTLLPFALALAVSCDGGPSIPPVTPVERLILVTEDTTASVRGHRDAGRPLTPVYQAAVLAPIQRGPLADVVDELSRPGAADDETLIHELELVPMAIVAYGELLVALGFDDPALFVPDVFSDGECGTGGELPPAPPPGPGCAAACGMAELSCFAECGACPGTGATACRSECAAHAASCRSTCE